MARYVIDAPTLLHLVTEPSRRSRASAGCPEPHPLASAVVLLAGVRRGEITEAVALERHERLTEMKMRLLGDRGVAPIPPGGSPREQGWDTTFDAEYLAVTKLQADALVTIDRPWPPAPVPIVPVAPLSALTAD